MVIYGRKRWIVHLKKIWLSRLFHDNDVGAGVNSGWLTIMIFFSKTPILHQDCINFHLGHQPLLKVTCNFQRSLMAQKNCLARLLKTTLSVWNSRWGKFKMLVIFVLTISHYTQYTLVYILADITPPTTFYGPFFSMRKRLLFFNVSKTGHT